MKLKSALPMFIFAALMGGFLFYLWNTRGQLPGRVATHFDLKGAPNGWMTNTGHFKFMAAFGLGVPLFIAVVFSLPRFISTRFVNLPNREQWLSGDRREETLQWLSRLGIWFGCVLLVFMGAIHHLIIEANAHRPPRLDNSALFIAVGLLLVSELALVVRLILRFSKRPAA